MAFTVERKAPQVTLTERHTDVLFVLWSVQIRGRQRFPISATGIAALLKQRRVSLSKASVMNVIRTLGKLGLVQEAPGTSGPGKRGPKPRGYTIRPDSLITEPLTATIAVHLYHFLIQPANLESCIEGIRQGPLERLSPEEVREHIGVCVEMGYLGQDRDTAIVTATQRVLRERLFLERIAKAAEPTGTPR